MSEKSLNQAFQTHDLFVHTSLTTVAGDREGIPNALLEAMSYGMPVISTRHAGIPEAIEHGQNGILIDESDDELLADAILSLIHQPDLFRTLSVNAAESVRTRFSVEACVKNLEATYSEAIAMRPVAH